MKQKEILLLITETCTHSFGQKSRRFRRFVQKLGVCPYKFEKNSGFFLESENKRRIFAISKVKRKQMTQIITKYKHLKS
jgi:hypothetical protein